MPLTAALPYHLHLLLFEERHWQFTKDFCPEMPLTAAALLNHLPGNSCQGYIVIFPLPWIVIFPLSSIVIFPLSVIFHWLLFTEWVTGYGWLELANLKSSWGQFLVGRFSQVWQHPPDDGRLVEEWKWKLSVHILCLWWFIFSSWKGWWGEDMFCIIQK